MLRANPGNFFSRIITGDETWVHHHDPETKQESMQWKHKGSPYSQEISFATISRKLGDNSFLELRRCSAYGIHATQAITTGDIYASTMVALHENIKQKHHGKLLAGLSVKGKRK